MSKRFLILLVASALLALAQKDESRKLRAWFADGTGVEYETETTGATILTSHGGSVMVNDTGIYRFVLDRAGNTLYSYRIEAFAGPRPGTVTIRIRPTDAETLQQAHHAARGVVDKTPGAIATVGSVREFPGVQKGQAIKLGILYNPATGEKIYD